MCWRKDCYWLKKHMHMHLESLSLSEINQLPTFCKSTSCFTPISPHTCIHAHTHAQPSSPHPPPHAVSVSVRSSSTLMSAISTLHTAHRCSSLWNHTVSGSLPHRSDAQTHLESWAAPPAWFCPMGCALRSRRVVGTERARVQPSHLDRQRRKHPVPATESLEHGPSALL